MLSVMRGMALAPHLATFNYFSPLPVASLGGSPPSFISSLDCEETRDLAYMARISDDFPRCSGLQPEHEGEISEVPQACLGFTILDST